MDNEKVTNDKKVNRNASASSFGWDFQVNAGIVLMLENIKEAKCIKIEGEYEDIEITLNDNEKIYAQVKFVERPYDDYRNVVQKFTSALETLNDASKNGDGKLFTYITNSDNPLNMKDFSYFFKKIEHYYFNELHVKIQKKINEIIDKKGYNNLDLNKFDLRIIDFYGVDPQQRYKKIREYLSKFLSSIFKDLKFKVEDFQENILNTWHRQFQYNTTLSNPNLSINKEKMIWSLIVLIINKVVIPKEYIEKYDEDYIEEIENKYSSIINNETLNYAFATKVIYHFKSLNTTEKDFIDNHWRFYIDDFKEIQNTSDIEILIKIVLDKIIKRIQCINTIKKEVCLNN